MSTIDKNADLMTLVNVFTVKPENQEKLVTLLTEATEQVMRNLPGFKGGGRSRRVRSHRVRGGRIDQRRHLGIAP